MLFRKSGDVFTSDDHTAGIRLEKPHENLQRNGFTYATAPENTDCFAGHDFETDSIEDRLLAEGFRDLAKLDIGTAHWFGH